MLDKLANHLSSNKASCETQKSDIFQEMLLTCLNPHKLNNLSDLNLEPIQKYMNHPLKVSNDKQFIVPFHTLMGLSKAQSIVRGRILDTKFDNDTALQITDKTTLTIINSLKEKIRTTPDMNSLAFKTLEFDDFLDIFEKFITGLNKKDNVVNIEKIKPTQKLYSGLINNLNNIDIFLDNYLKGCAPNVTLDILKQSAGINPHNFETNFEVMSMLSRILSKGIFEEGDSTCIKAKDFMQDFVQSNKNSIEQLESIDREITDGRNIFIRRRPPSSDMEVIAQMSILNYEALLEENPDIKFINDLQKGLSSRICHLKTERNLRFKMLKKGFTIVK